MTRSGHYVWTPPAVCSPQRIPAEVREWLSNRSCAVLGTIEANGVIQLSVMWAACSDDTLLMSTVAGRRKHHNLQRDPRATAIVSPLGDQDHYVEMRGIVAIGAEGGRQLIDDLHEHYRGTRPYPWDAPGDERLVLALRPERVLVFHG
jgi:PPOX class probable F420-dependent enzyme